MRFPVVPKIGLRIFKSALAVFLCFVIAHLHVGSIPFYSAIAAILCMQPDIASGFRVGINRAVGTLIGGFYGMFLLYLLRIFMHDNTSLVYYGVISAAIIPLIYLTILLKQTTATYITCVVFLSVTVSHGSDLVPAIFALNRIFDTLIGIFISLFLNWIPFLRGTPAAPDPEPPNAKV